jgi:hypothetical protein
MVDLSALCNSCDFIVTYLAITSVFAIALAPSEQRGQQYRPQNTFRSK